MGVRTSASIKVLISVALLNYLAACRGGSIDSASSKSISNTLGIVTDNSCWLGQGTEAAASIAYEDSCRFDRQVRGSLSSPLPEVTVTTDGAFRQDAMPTRLGNWLERVRSSGGSVATCTVNDGSMGIIVILPLLWKVFDTVKTYALYDPATKYDAAIVAAKSGSIDRVVFTRRSAALACPAGTTKTTPAP